MQQRTRGFTLVELIVSITLIGILAAVAVPMLRTPLAAFADASRRADLTAELDASVAGMRNDLAQALPNSIRVRQVGGRYFLEFLQVRASGRYRVAKDTSTPSTSCPATCSVPGDNDVLEFNVCNESCFTSLGSLLSNGTATAAGSDWVVVNAIDASAAVPLLSEDPYFGGATAPVGGVKSRLLGDVAAPGNSRRINVTPHWFPAPAPSRQFYIVSNPVSYECDPATRRLTRYDGYAMAAVQPTVFPAAGAAPLATMVSQCEILYTRYVNPNGAPGRAGGVVTIWLRFTPPPVAGTTPESVESFSEIGVREPA